MSVRLKRPIRAATHGRLTRPLSVRACILPRATEIAEARLVLENDPARLTSAVDLAVQRAVASVRELQGRQGRQGRQGWVPSTRDKRR